MNSNVHVVDVFLTVVLKASLCVCVRVPQSDFLDFYVSYLKELPDCLSVVSMLASSSMKSSALLEVEHTVNKQELMTLSLQSTQQEHFTVVTE